MYRSGIVQLHYPLNTTLKNTSLNFNPLTNVGHAQIVSNVGVFGDGSAYFDGKGDRYWADPGLSFGLNDFTIEFWLYLKNGGSQFARIIAFGPDATQGSLYIVRESTSNAFRVEIYDNGSYVQLALNIVIEYEIWNHVSLVRKDGNFFTRLNGQSPVSSTIFQSYQITQSLLSIGSNTSNGESLFGNITDLRITYGKALYTENFTPPGRHTSEVIGNPVIRNVLNYSCDHESTLAIPQDTRVNEVLVQTDDTRAIPQDTRVNEVLVQTDDTRAGFTDTILRGEKTSTHRFSGNKTITGTLFRIGTPLPNTEVSLYERRSLQLVDITKTNDNGIFTFSHINQESDLYIIANDPLNELLPASDKAGNNLNIHQSKIKVELGGKTISGTIWIGGVSVFVYDWLSKILISKTITNHDGSWSVEVPFGEYMITYIKEGCRPVTNGPYTAS